MSDRFRPFHLVNDNPMDRSVGIHTRTAWMSVGTPTIRPSTIRSRPDSRRPRRARAGGADTSAGAAAADGRLVCGLTLIGSLGRIQGLGLCLDVGRVDGPVLEEALQGRD